MNYQNCCQLSLRVIIAFTILCLVNVRFTLAEEKKQSKKEEKITYDDHVKPIFRQKCFGCHNTDKKVGGLDLTSYTSLMEGGGSGEVVEPGSASDSYLFMVVNHDSEPYMPPKSEKVAGDMIATLQKWIDGGALENSSSKANIKKKPGLALLNSAPSTQRPEGPMPMPARMPLEPVIHTERAAAATALATSPWAHLVAVAGQKQVLVYDTKTLELKSVLPFPEGIAHSLHFSRNGKLLLAGGGRHSYQGKVVVWDITTGKRVVEVGDEVDTVLAADISSDQSKIALCGPSKMVRVYSVETGELLYQIKKHTDWVTACAFSPDGVLLATGDRNGGLHVWEAFTGREYLTLNAHKARVTQVSWRSDSNILASASEDNTVRLWELNGGGQVKNWTAHSGAMGVEFTRDGRLVTCGRDKLVRVWDQNGKRLAQCGGFRELALQVTHCDETDRVIAGDWLGEIRVWNAQDGKEIGTLSANPLPLAERLKNAQQALASQQAQFAKLQQSYSQAMANVTNINKQIAATKQAETNANQAIATIQANTKTATDEIAKATQQKTNALNQIKTLDQKITTSTKQATDTQTAIVAAQKKLADLTARLAAAANAADVDKLTAEIDAAHADHTKLVTAFVKTKKDNLALQATRAQQKNAVTQADTLIKSKQANLKTYQRQVTDNQTIVANARKSLTQFAANLKSAQEQAAKIKQQYDAAQASVQQADASVRRWQDEIQFAQQHAGLARGDQK